MHALLLSAALAAAGPARFSLIVTYNGGIAVNRPPLHYADDDGAKYREVFEALDEPNGTLLLTEFDDDSARLFPELVTSTPAPTLANVDVAADALKKQVAAARAAGRPTELTFVYAGHGDVDQGKGFLVLKDGTLDGEAVEKLLKTIGADRSDVILDSCNSFFVLTPRGGGRRFATPSDVADKLKAQLPNVGLFLSTNAEAEVFEWSELQSGVFSHAVRSGLLGAADANGDGVVTYEELAAFVDRATADIKNPLFRPKLFARGPSGDNQAALADLRSSSLPALTVDDLAAVRLSIRDRDGVRWLDLHKEAGSKAALHLPARVAAGGSVQLGDRELSLPNPFRASALAMLVESKSKPAVRGTSEILQTLFAQPFGPAAYQAYEATQKTEPEPVFGVSGRERERLDTLLSEIADNAKNTRRTAAASAFLVAGFSVGGGIALAASPNGPSTPTNFNQWIGGTFIGAGAVIAGIGTYQLVFNRSEPEQIVQRFADQLKEGSEEEAYRAVDLQLDALDAKLHRSRSHRLTASLVGVAFGLGLIAWAAWPHTNLDQPLQTLFEVEGTALLGSAAIVAPAMLFQEDPTTRLIRLWREDRSGIEVSGVSIAPTNGGATVGLGGRF